MSRRVVITGLGTVNPLGNNVETTWDNVKKGVCGIDEITRIDTTNHAVKLAGEVKNLDVTAVIDKKDARRMDRYAQYAVVAAGTEHAGYGCGSHHFITACACKGDQTCSSVAHAPNHTGCPAAPDGCRVLVDFCVGLQAVKCLLIFFMIRHSSNPP